MGFNKKNQGVPSVWDNIKKNSEREDAGIWSEVDFAQIIENTERLYYYARLIAGVLPEHTNLAEKIRLVWGGENWRTLVFLVKEPLVANQRESLPEWGGALNTRGRSARERPPRDRSYGPYGPSTPYLISACRPGFSSTCP